MPGLTIAQIENFYRTLEFADVLAAGERQRLRQNLDAMVQQDAGGEEKGSTHEVEILQRLRDSRTQHLNSATLFTLMEQPPKYALDGDGSDRQRVRLRRLFELFKSQRVLLWSFPEDLFQDEETAELSDTTAPGLISIIEEYADAVIGQAVLPLLGRESSTARVDRRVIRTLMATAVALRRFRFESIEAANEFFADAYRRFQATRSHIVDSYLTTGRYEELYRRVTSQTKSRIRGRQHEEDREDVIADVLGKVSVTLNDPRFPTPAERFATDEDFFQYVASMTGKRIADFFRASGREPGTVSLPDVVEAPAPGRATPPDDNWQAVSRILNEELEQGFGTDSICSSIEVAETAFVPGAAVAFLMLLRRQQGEEGYSEDEALAEIQSAADGSWAPGAKQFVNAKDRDVSPAQLWESCHPSWNSLLVWRGELPAFRLPESWSSLVRLLPANGAVTEAAFDEVYRQWAGFVGAVDNLRRWIVLQVLKTTTVWIPTDDGPHHVKPLTWKEIHKLLTNPDAAPQDSDRSRPDSGPGGEAMSPQARWSLINDQVPSAGLPSSWPQVRSWFEGRIHGGHESVRIMAARLLKFLVNRVRRTSDSDLRGVLVTSSDCDRHQVADVTRSNGTWYLATTITDQQSGRQGIQVLGSGSGEDWRQIGSGTIVGEQELTLPRFEAASQQFRSGRAVPSIQLSVHDPGTANPASLISDYSLEQNVWTAPTPLVTEGHLLSHLLVHDESVWALGRTAGEDGVPSVWLYSGATRDQLQPCDDLCAGMTDDTGTADAHLLRDDLATVTRASLFSRDDELWCILHCAGPESHRNWIGVRPSEADSGWEWWRAGTALFSDHRYVVPDPAEIRQAVRPGCAVSPARVCQIEDGSWWLTGTAHESGQKDAEDVLCRIFLPRRGTTPDGTALPVFCQTRTLGTAPASELRHSGMASSGPLLLTTYLIGRSHPTRRQRTPVVNGPSLLTRLFHAVTANTSRV